MGYRTPLATRDTRSLYILLGGFIGGGKAKRWRQLMGKEHKRRNDIHPLPTPHFNAMQYSIWKQQELEIVSMDTVLLMHECKRFLYTIKESVVAPLKRILIDDE